MELNCSNCPWASDPEACRICRAQQAEKAKAVDRLMDADVPGHVARVKSQDKMNKLLGTLEAALRANWEFHAVDAVLLGFVCILGQEHVHWIGVKADAIEWTDPEYGHQN